MNYDMIIINNFFYMKGFVNHIFEFSIIYILAFLCISFLI